MGVAENRWGTLLHLITPGFGSRGWLRTRRARSRNGLYCCSLVDNEALALVALGGDT